MAFTLPLTNQAEADLVSRISLVPYYPPSLFPTALRAASIISSDIIAFEWDGVEAGIAEPHYYKLTIPGGRGGVSDGASGYFKETRYLYIEVLP
jgi:hypothetical protein